MSRRSSGTTVSTVLKGSEDCVHNNRSIKSEFEDFHKDTETVKTDHNIVGFNPNTKGFVRKVNDIISLWIINKVWQRSQMRRCNYEIRIVSGTKI